MEDLKGKLAQKKPLSIIPGLSDKLAARALDLFTLDKILNDPWILLEVPGISFRRADKVSQELGIPKESTGRIVACGMHSAQNIAFNTGSIYNWWSYLVFQCTEELGLPKSNVESTLEGSGKFIINREKNLFALKQYHDYEESIAKQLIWLNRKWDEDDYKVRQVKQLIKKEDWLKARTGVDYTEEQKTAVESVFLNGVTVITGGPGTGKTTLLRGVHFLAQEANLNVHYAAFVGRAARRMAEAIGDNCNATTIHRMLQYKGGKFLANEKNPIYADLVVIDESSMLDTTMIYHILKALQSGTRIVFVGDINQLPSIGPGQILKDIIDSDMFNTVFLTKPFRQAESSTIVRNAYKILNNEMIEIDNKSGTDFFFVNKEDEGQALKYIRHLYKTVLPTVHKFDSKRDIQILIPTYERGTVSINNVNKCIQLDMVGRNDLPFCVSDKIINTRNNYDKGVMNGDLGKVIGTSEGRVVARFGTEQILYQADELEDLDLAYAISIHKAQGSEFPCVIVPVFSCYGHMLQKRLFYTAITRATKLAIIVGQFSALSQALITDEVAKRNTGLLDKLISSKM